MVELCSRRHYGGAGIARRERTRTSAGRRTHVCYRRCSTGRPRASKAKGGWILIAATLRRIGETRITMFWGASCQGTPSRRGVHAERDWLLALRGELFSVRLEGRILARN